MTGVTLILIVLMLVALALVSIALLHWSSGRRAATPAANAAATPATALPAPADALIDALDALLPQTQCTRCGYAGCRPYATAIAHGEADINQCPPGGAHGIRSLADLLGVEAKPLNPAHGLEQPKLLARIVEADCVGCTKCIQACPVDAIIGGPKHMHTVIAELCTGCELCVPPCPVDCIQMVPAPAVPNGSRRQRAGVIQDRLSTLI